MQIREVARRTGLAEHTIRYYEQLGLLPRISRTEAGVRQFSEADVAFLQFVVSIKQTGMPLDEVAQFTEGGCILERLQRGEIPTATVCRRSTILRGHRERLLQQRSELEALLQAVDQKLGYYDAYLARRQNEA